MPPSGFGQFLARGTACHNCSLCQPCPTEFHGVMWCGSELVSAFLWTVSELGTAALETSQSYKESSNRLAKPSPGTSLRKEVLLSFTFLEFTEEGTLTILYSVSPSRKAYIYYLIFCEESSGRTNHARMLRNLWELSAHSGKPSLY